MRPRTKTANNTLITAMIISKNNVILISYVLTKPLVMSGTRINAELAAMLTYDEAVALFVGNNFIIILIASWKIPAVNNPKKKVLTMTMLYVSI